MPWIVEEGEERFVPREPPPEITLPDPDAPWPDIEGSERLRRDRVAVWLWWRRTIADFYEIHKFCPRVACRRAAACAGPDAACHAEAIDLLRETVYPRIREALRASPPE